MTTSGCSETNPQLKKDADIHYELGVDALHQNNPSTAFRELFKALGMSPNDPKIHNTIGLVYMGKEMFEKAEASFKKAIEIKPAYSDAWNNLGALYLSLGRWDSAIKACENAATDVLYPYPWLPENNIGWAWFKKGDFKQAMYHLERAVRDNPRFCRGWEHLGQVYLALGKPEKAEPAFRKSIERCPGFQFPEAHFHLAVCLEKLGRKKDAAAELEKCALEGNETKLGTRCRMMLKTRQEIESSQ